MNNNNTQKSVLALFSAIAQGYKTKKEIISELQISEKLFSKNLTLLKKAGFKIMLNQRNYRFKNLKTDFEFKNNEKDILAYLMALSSALFPKKNSKEFESLSKKVCNLGAFDYKKLYKKAYFYKLAFLSENCKEKIETINRFIELKQAIQITLSNKKQIDTEPLYIKWEQEEFIFCFINLESEQKGSVLLKNVKKIIPVEQKNKYLRKKEIIFSLNGKLVQSYNLKDDERVIELNETELIVANSSKDKIALYKRLLRYDILCKVLYPKNAREEFKKITEESIKNIEGAKSEE